MKIAIIGGGAAGFFAAIHASGPGNEVTIFEKSPKILSKVRISGGGRCNVTHQPMEISKLIKNYPRGEKFLKKAFRHFSISDTFKWFESRGVSLKIEKAKGKRRTKTKESEKDREKRKEQGEKNPKEKSCALKKKTRRTTKENKRQKKKETRKKRQ